MTDNFRDCPAWCVDQSRGLTAESSNSATLVKQGACLRGGQQRIDCATQQMKWGLELWRNVTRHDSTLLGVDVRVLIDALVRCPIVWMVGLLLTAGSRNVHRMSM